MLRLSLGRILCGHLEWQSIKCLHLCLGICWTLVLPLIRPHSLLSLSDHLRGMLLRTSSTLMGLLPRTVIVSYPYSSSRIISISCHSCELSSAFTLASFAFSTFFTYCFRSFYSIRHMPSNKKRTRPTSQVRPIFSQQFPIR